MGGIGLRPLLPAAEDFKKAAKLWDNFTVARIIRGIVAAEIEVGPKDAELRIMRCDLHARQQAVAMLDIATGEVVKMTL